MVDPLHFKMGKSHWLEKRLEIRLGLFYSWIKLLRGVDVFEKLCGSFKTYTHSHPMWCIKSALKP